MNSYLFSHDPDKTAEDRIFCPILSSFTAVQADCAAMIPSGDANSLLQTQLAHIKTDHDLTVGVFCSDPFLNPDLLFEELYDKGVRQVINWPSLILLDHNTKQAMQSIGLEASSEYEYLATAQEKGLKAFAMISSLNQAKKAIASGLTSLVVHPGFQLKRSAETINSLNEALVKLVENIVEIDPTLEIYLYQHTHNPQDDHLKKFGHLKQVIGVIAGEKENG